MYDLTPMEELRALIAATIFETEEKSYEDQAQAIIDELTLSEELGEGDNPRLSRFVTDWSQR